MIINHCPNCKKNYSNLLSPEYKLTKTYSLKLGPPIIRCSFCKNLYHTDHILLKNYNDYNRKLLTIWISLCILFDNLFSFATLLLGFGSIITGFIPLFFLVDMLKNYNYIGIIITSLLTFLFFRSGFTYLKALAYDQSLEIIDFLGDYYEDIYNKNGGYIWSSELFIDS